MKYTFEGIFENQTVLVTGHTGFKGSWLSLWLQELGAKVIGFSLDPPTISNNFTVSRASEKMVDLRGDVRDFNTLQNVFKKYSPTVVFHLAAQPLVLQSFEEPKETFDINVGGTVNLLEAIRHCQSVKAAVMVTSDKCYENKEWQWGYRENDQLGGEDPYSASKCMSEQVIASYRSSFFKKIGSAAIASVRAGNVIGGGDFSDYRIVPDCMKALISKTKIKVRNPKSVRPWLNVLDPLSGYLWLANRLLNHNHDFAEAWNFGPLEQQGITVQTLVEKAIQLWGNGEWTSVSQHSEKAEMGLLRLSWDKAIHRLRWTPTYSWIDAIQQTVDWFKAYEEFNQNNDFDMREKSISHIQKYVSAAQSHNLVWAQNAKVDSELKHG